MTSKLEDVPPELYRGIFKNLDPSSLLALCTSTKNRNIKADAHRRLRTMDIRPYIEKDDIKAIDRFLYWLYKTNQTKKLDDLFLYAISHKANKIIKFLLTKIDTINVNRNIDGKLPIEYLIEDENLELAKLLIYYPGFNPNKNEVLSNAPGPFAIELLKHPSINPNIDDGGQDIPLIRAVISSDLPKLEALLKHPKIKVNKKTFGNMTALHLLMDMLYTNNTLKMLKRLLAHPRVRIGLKNVEGENVLHIAIRTRKPREILELLLQYPEIKLNTPTFPIQTPNGHFIPGKTVFDYADIYEYPLAQQLLEKAKQITPRR